MRFFAAVLQPRFPKTIAEGAMKGLMLGGLILGPYDLFSPMPKNIDEIASHSQFIVNGYKLLVLVGAICGFIGEFCLHNHQPETPGARTARPQ